MASDWLTPSEAARKLGVSVATVRHMADRGKLVCERTPLGRVISEASVQEMRLERAGGED